MKAGKISYAGVGVAVGGVIGFLGVFVGWFKYTYPLGDDTATVTLSGTARLDRHGRSGGRLRRVRVRRRLRAVPGPADPPDRPASRWPSRRRSCSSCRSSASPGSAKAVGVPAAEFTTGRAYGLGALVRRRRHRGGELDLLASSRDPGAGPVPASVAVTGGARRGLTHEAPGTLSLHVGGTGTASHVVGPPRTRCPGRSPARSPVATPSVAREHGTPVYVYDLHARAGAGARAAIRVRTRRADGRVRLALKAQHEPELLRFVARTRASRERPESVGMDVCSPREIEWALAHGWRPDEISYTGTNLSERDLDVILAHPDVHLNVDLLTQIDRVGRPRTGSHDRDPRQPARRRRVRGRRAHALLGRPTDEVRHLPRAARRGAGGREPTRPDDRHGPLPRRGRLPERRARRSSRRSFGAWRTWCARCSSRVSDRRGEHRRRSRRAAARG